MRSLSTLATLLLGLAVVFWAPVANAALCPDGSYVSGSTCTLCPNGSYVGGGQCVLQPDGSYTGGYGGYGGSPGPTFNAYPALQVRPPDIYGAFQRGQRNAEVLRNLRLQNQLLQQQLQTPTAGDRHYALLGGTTAPMGKTVAWNNPNSGNYGTVKPTREGIRNGEWCRQYDQTIVIAGRNLKGNATACRQDDGNWVLQ